MLTSENLRTVSQPAIAPGVEARVLLELGQRRTLTWLAVAFYNFGLDCGVDHAIGCSLDAFLGRLGQHDKTLHDHHRNAADDGRQSVRLDAGAR